MEDERHPLLRTALSIDQTQYTRTLPRNRAPRLTCRGPWPITVYRAVAVGAGLFLDASGNNKVSVRAHDGPVTSEGITTMTANVYLRGWPLAIRKPGAERHHATTLDLALAHWRRFRALGALRAAEEDYRRLEQRFGDSYEDVLGLLSPATFSPTLLLRARRAYRRAVGAFRRADLQYARALVAPYVQKIESQEQTATSDKEA